MSNHEKEELIELCALFCFLFGFAAGAVVATFAAMTPVGQ